MQRTSAQLATIGFGGIALLCWLVMFLAGTDIWHAMGRPDLGHLQGPSSADVRAFAYAFYALPIVLAVNVVTTATAFVRSRRIRAH